VTALARFLIRRLLGIAVLAWAATAATFALLRVGIPNPGIDAAISQQLGPGQPAVSQYFHYLLHLLHGNLGQSLVQPVSVNTILGQAVPPTLSRSSPWLRRIARGSGPRPSRRSSIRHGTGS